MSFEVSDKSYIRKLIFIALVVLLILLLPMSVAAVERGKSEEPNRTESHPERRQPQLVAIFGTNDVVEKIKQTFPELRHIHNYKKPAYLKEFDDKKLAHFVSSHNHVSIQIALFEIVEDQNKTFTRLQKWVKRNSLDVFFKTDKLEPLERVPGTLLISGIRDEIAKAVDQVGGLEQGWAIPTVRDEKQQRNCDNKEHYICRVPKEKLSELEIHFYRIEDEDMRVADALTQLNQIAEAQELSFSAEGNALLTSGHALMMGTGEINGASSSCIVDYNPIPTSLPNNIGTGVRVAIFDSANPFTPSALIASALSNSSAIPSERYIYTESVPSLDHPPMMNNGTAILATPYSIPVNSHFPVTVHQYLMDTGTMTPTNELNHGLFVAQRAYSMSPGSEYHVYGIFDANGMSTQDKLILALGDFLNDVTTSGNSQAVINFSFNFIVDTNVTASNSVEGLLSSHNFPVVQAAGNTYNANDSSQTPPSLTYPSAHRIAGITGEGQGNQTSYELAGYSNIGDIAFYSGGARVSLFGMPLNENERRALHEASPYQIYGYGWDNNDQSWKIMRGNGTSMAAPQAAAAIAAHLSANTTNPHAFWIGNTFIESTLTDLNWADNTTLVNHPNAGAGFFTLAAVDWWSPRKIGYCPSY